MGRRDNRGTLVRHVDADADGRGRGEHATLIFRRTYPHPAAAVWEAIATPEGLRGWLMCTDVTLEPHVGGRIDMVSGPGRYHSTGRILVWEPPKVLAYEWNVAPLPEMPRGERAIFRYELTSDPSDQAASEVTHLLVTYERITLGTAPGFLPGLHAFLDRLEAQLEHRALPDWAERFGELRPLYPEWQEHAHATSPGK